MLNARTAIFRREAGVKEAPKPWADSDLSFLRSSILSDDLILASMPTRSSVPEVSVHASTKPLPGLCSVCPTVESSSSTDFCSFWYADSGGSPSSSNPLPLEYATDANM